MHEHWRIVIDYLDVAWTAGHEAFEELIGLYSQASVIIPTEAAI
jgi:hypothetical protein